MKKKTLFCITLILALTLAASAYAAQKLGTYSLVVDHEKIELTASTGYIYKSGSVLLIPIKAVCDKLGYGYEAKLSVNGCSITRPDGGQVALRAGSAYAAVDGTKMKLRSRTVVQPGAIITCDVRVVKFLLAGFKNYYASLAKPAGYPSGALVIADDGDLTLPSVTPPTDVLPEEIKPAARNASQIVGVKYLKDSRATLTLYEKVNNVWLEQYSTTAYVGSQGIGKTKEGDNKTPSGTYNLTTPFGILRDPGSKMKGYTKVTKYHYWCSNSSSKYYNRMIDIRQVDYTPAAIDEKLISVSPYYNYALFIDYNAECAPGAGSAIFLHCTGSKTSTSGCVAVPQAVMKSLLMTLAPGAKIVIY